MALFYAFACFNSALFAASGSCLLLAAEIVTTAKTAAQRQADRKARELAAGRVQWKRWVHPEDVPALAEFADKLARKRAKQAAAVPQTVGNR